MNYDSIKLYVRYGFTGVQVELRDEFRVKEKAKDALRCATSAWLQHLKRSIADLKQIAVFIKKTTYDEIQKFRNQKIHEGKYGHGITQEGVIEDLLISGLRINNPLVKNILPKA